jgi:hypothetical protein
MLIRTVENKDNNMIDTGYLRLNITNNHEYHQKDNSQQYKQ